MEKYTVELVQVAQDKNGNDYKKIKVEGVKETLFVFPRAYKDYEKIEEGAELGGVISTSGKFKHFVDTLEPPKYIKESRAQQVAGFEAKKTENIKEAMKRKDESIAYFNSVNSAIQIVTASPNFSSMREEDVVELIRKWRNWFFEEWKDKPPF